MEKHKRVEAELPEEIIQHIQSFLNGKEAAQTTIISKSWYEAWLTRPDLDFSQSDINDEKSFINFGTKTMQRYEELNRKIQSLNLRVECWSLESLLSDTISQAKEWTKKSTKLGVADLHISYYPMNYIIFLLPREVLESQTLVRLSLSGRCVIDLHNQKVSCSRLKYLHLVDVRIEGNTDIWDLISMCPLIEELIISTRKHEMVFNSGLDKNIFHKLKVLTLMNVETGELFFHDLSSKFPCLKELTLLLSIRYKEIQICSNSLESIECTSFHTMLSAKFDVPRIKKFKFFTWGLPSLSFNTTSTEWESDITIQWEISCDTKLRKFLQELSPSKIYLYLCINGLAGEEYDSVGDLTCLPKPPIVEKLTINNIRPSKVYSAVLEDLFWSCRPNFLVLYFKPLMKLNSNNVAKFLFTTPVEEANTYRNMFDLEKVNVGFFQYDDHIHGWLPLSCETLLEASAYSKHSNVKVCLKLTWGDGI